MRHAWARVVCGTPLSILTLTAVLLLLLSTQVAPVPIQQCVLSATAGGQDGPAATAETALGDPWDIGSHADIVLVDLFDHRLVTRGGAAV